MTAEDVLAAWFSGERETYRVERWFRRDDAFDAMLRERFGPAVAAAREGAHAAWTATPLGTLGLVILLDQLPRNIHRGTQLAFACDARARDVARAALGRGVAGALTAVERSFLFLPFEHAENLLDQDVSVELFTGLAGDPRMPTVLDYAERHRDVIRRFGRFPHRNAALGRASTDDEMAYLAEPGAGFWGMAMDWSFMPTQRIVRLNARLFPAGDYERAQWRRFGMQPVEAEAATPADLIALVAEADAVFAISVALPAEVVNAMARCRVISRLGTGTDKIAVGVAKDRGILVTNVPYFCVEEQADHAMALLLALVRKLPQSAADMLAGEYRHAQAAVRSNRRLDGRTLGLVGFGNSAKHMARRAQGFGLKVIATRRRMAAEDAAALGVELVDLTTLLQRSDYVSLHLPLVQDTYHLIGRQALALMKPDAMLINTSRGALVDEDALHDALTSGRLGAAGLDTFERIDVFADATTPPDLPLLRLPNVIATPHVAAGSVESGHDVSRGGVENMATVLAGHWPIAENIVNAGVVPRTPLRPYDQGLLG